MKRLAKLLLLSLLFAGCSTSPDGKSTTLNIGPIIGLIGMAVDGDDKDDYEKFFHDDDCCCRCCK